MQTVPLNQVLSIFYVIIVIQINPFSYILYTAYTLVRAGDNLPYVIFLDNHPPAITAPNTRRIRSLRLSTRPYTVVIFIALALGPEARHLKGARLQIIARLVGIASPISTRCGCSIVGSEVLDEGAEARDRGSNDGVCKLCLCPGDVFGLKDGRIGGQAGNIEGCETKANGDN
jgi:hypothetical protein